MKSALRLFAVAAVALGMLTPAVRGQSTAILTTIYSFAGADGANPYGGLVQGSDGNFYGTTSGGGSGSDGTVFSMTPAGVLTTLHNFTGADGTTPIASLVQGSDGNFYGTASAGGGSSNDGTVFSITPAGVLTTLHTFTGTGPDGAAPDGALVQGSDGNFYGTTSVAGSSSDGTVFSITPAGMLTTLHSFDYTDGYEPFGGLVQGSDGNFYGTTYTGGSGPGTVFQITPAGMLTTLHAFDGTDGQESYAGLVQGRDGNFYGTTFQGGVYNNDGTIFKITPAGSLTTLHNFSGGDGSEPFGGLVQGRDGNFYGVTFTGGDNNRGAFYQLTPAGALNVLASFGTSDGTNSECTLIQASDGNFYGTTYGGGASGKGSIFKVAVSTPGTVQFAASAYTVNENAGSVSLTAQRLNGSTGTISVAYDEVDDTAARGTDYLGGNGTLTWTDGDTAGKIITLPIVARGLNDNTTKDFSVVLSNATGGASLGTSANATVTILDNPETLSILHGFTYTDGAGPEATLAKGSDGNFYGTTNAGGGGTALGTIFSITPVGVLTVLHVFIDSATDGALPQYGLVEGSDGNFYGASNAGGTRDEGTVYSITPTGTFTLLHSFMFSDGDTPDGPLVQGSDGNFYGSTYQGGGFNAGTIFSITSTGGFSTVYTFSLNTDGTDPRGGLIQGGDGNFYGTTYSGGANGNGTVFQLTPAGALTTLYSFASYTSGTINADGASPQGTLTQGSDGNFYGTTSYGGGSGDGTIFSITPAGALTTLYNFTGPDGESPRAGLAQGPDGNFYGTTYGGGGNNFGTLFSITPTGTLTTLYNFTGTVTDGGTPYAGLVLGSDGNFYGVTNAGGSKNDGTVFKLSLTPSAGALQFAATTYRVNEDAGSVTLIVNRAGGSAGAVSVDFTDTDGTAFAGLDYQVTGGTLTWADGDATNRAITIPVNDRGLSGGGVVSFTVNLTNPGGGATYGAIDTATVNIVDNDAASTPTPTPTVTPTPTPTATPTPTPTPTPSPTVSPTPVPTPGAQPSVVITSPPDGITVTVGEDLPLSAAITDPDGLTSQVRFSVGSALVDTASAASAPFVFDTLAPTAPGQYAVQVTVVDTFGRANAASVNILVIAATDAAPPSAGLLTPVSGRDLAAGSTLTLSFDAAAASTTALDHVSLYADGAVVATFDASGNLIPNAAQGATPTRRDAAPLANLFQTPYTLPGTDKLVNLVAVAVDKLGQSAVSKVATVHAKVTSDKAPVVAFGGVSSGGTHLRVGSTNTFSVNASDPDATTGTTSTAAATATTTGPHRADASSDATLALLEYYLNGTKIGEATTPPFRFTFTPPAAGRYILHAVATDGSGLSTISEPAVVEADPAPTVNLAIGGSGAAVESGANGVIVVTRTGDTSLPLTVSYKAKGTAVAGVDYKKLPGSVTIPAGAVKAKIKVKPIDGSPNAGVLKLKLQPLVPSDGSYVVGTPLIKLKLIGK